MLLECKSVAVEGNNRLFTPGKLYDAKTAEGNLRQVIDDLGRARCLLVENGKAQFCLGTDSASSVRANFAFFEVVKP